MRSDTDERVPNLHDLIRWIVWPGLELRGKMSISRNDIEDAPPGLPEKTVCSTSNQQTNSERNAAEHGLRSLAIVRLR